MNLSNFNSLIELFFYQSERQNPKSIFLEWLNPNNKKIYTWEETTLNIFKLSKILKETVKVAMRMLDNVIDLNFYPTPEAKNSNLKHRPIGLGLMGFQDALYKMDLQFDSVDAVKFSDDMMEFISFHSILTSSEIAREKGCYESFSGSKWDQGLFPIDTLRQLGQERDMEIAVDLTTQLDWSVVKEHVKEYGMRNSNCMAIAPTATIANISGCFPSIEPIYKNIYAKSNLSGEFTMINCFLIELSLIHI